MKRINFWDYKYGSPYQKEVDCWRDEINSFATITMIYYEKGQQNFRAPLHFREPKVWNLCISFAHRVWLLNFGSHSSTVCLQVLESREPTWNWPACTSWEPSSLNWNSRGEHSHRLKILHKFNPQPSQPSTYLSDDMPETTGVSIYCGLTL